MSKKVLPVIVVSQFFCTSLWFAGNAIMGDVARQFDIAPEYLAHIASAVQLGFITGTLVFAILSLADRISPSKLFFCCALIAAAVNLSLAFIQLSTTLLLSVRFITGFFLAGIYPVGMKIAADYFDKGLGKSLGFLVGALVLGTAFPHFLKSIPAFSWRYVIYATSILATLGGLAMLLLVPDGPYRKPSQQFKLSAFLSGFKNADFRASAFGYFGHMWELYAFWVFVPVMLTSYQEHSAIALNIPLLSFIIIAMGSLACAGSGLLSQKFGTKKVAVWALYTSCLCCLVSPVFFISSVIIFITFLLVWSIAVIADSPLFSTLVAQNAPAETKGTSLTIVNCIGFSITIFSIQIINALRTEQNMHYIFMLLAIGPVLGLIALFNNKGR
ncbi:MFS transporter [Mucilaginibacter terrae]|uniref:MFS family permease n=1 Tax=Mucilaginibacter terrae TaxID=1955052 RepID=A0ABU3GX44_9SPHI|nr:MFS transporter [Mucilaginibacter terrae]MDT3404338.1 MFS family permease [Mucilaginibacter terrae]